MLPGKELQSCIREKDTDKGEEEGIAVIYQHVWMSAADVW